MRRTTPPAQKRLAGSTRRLVWASVDARLASDEPATLGIDMSRSAFQRAVMLVCLMAFGLGQTVLAPFVVRCEDQSGRTRFEIACAKSFDGSCLSLCGFDAAGSSSSGSSDSTCGVGDLHTPHSCTDKPVTEPTNSAKLRPRAESIDALFFVVHLSEVFHPMVRAADPAAPTDGTTATSEQAPDSATWLRTVILTV